MSLDTENTQDTLVAPEQSSQYEGAITPDLVSEITDKVYALLLSDLKIENERNQTFPKWRWNIRGGR